MNSISFGGDDYFEGGTGQNRRNFEKIEMVNERQCNSMLHRSHCQIEAVVLFCFGFYVDLFVFGCFFFEMFKMGGERKRI